MIRPLKKIRAVRAARISILMSPAQVSSEDNPFVHMLVESVQNDVDVRDFSWMRAFFSRYDILHVHWPERMTSNPNATRRTAKSLAFLALIAWNHVRSVAHVGTVHNLRPHENGNRLEDYAISVWNRSCRVRIFLSKSGLANDDLGTGEFIPHGDYQPFVSQHSGDLQGQSHHGLLSFGYLRPYKGIEQLIQTLRDDDSVSLTVAGKPTSPEYAESLRRAATGAGVDLRMRAQSAEELIALIKSSEAIVLPYRHIYNSGAAILALTLGRPIIVTYSASMVELRDEVGSAWVELLPGEWSARNLRDSLQRVRSATREPVAPFVGRSWSSVGALHVDLYRRIVEDGHGIAGVTET